MQAGNDLTMVGGALQNTGKGATTLSAGNSIMLIAHERGSHVLQDPNAPFDPNNYTKSGTYDQTGGTIDVGGSLSLTAGKDIFAQGTQVNAGGAINLKAEGDISITTALKGSEFESKSQYTSSSMWGLGKKITTTTVTNTHLRNTLSSWNGASFSARAGRDLTLQGTQVNAGGIDLRAGNDLNVLAVFDVDEMSHTKSVVNKGLAKLLGQDSSDNYYDITRKALMPSLNAGGSALSFVAGNTLNLESPKLTAGSIYYEANHINDKVVKDFRQVEETHTRKNLLWQRTDSVGSINEVAHLSQFNVPAGAFNFKAPGGINVQLPEGSDLRQQIERMASQPGQDYLREFANRSDIDWQRIEVVNKT